MTNYIPITTPTTKVNRCNKGTKLPSQTELLFSKFKHTHTHRFLVNEHCSVQFKITYDQPHRWLSGKASTLSVGNRIQILAVTPVT